MRGGLLSALLVLLLALGAREPGAAEYGSAARVNGVEISLFRLERHFEDYLREQRRSVAQIRNPSVYKRLKREALEQLIDKELLWQAARRQGIEVSEAEVVHARAALAARFASPQAFARRLHAAGFDEAGYAEYLHREIAASRLLDRLAPTATLSDAEVRSFHRVLQAQGSPLADAPFSAEQQRAAARQILLAQRRAAARRAVLDQLRAAARIELLLPL